MTLHTANTLEQEPASVMVARTIEWESLVNFITDAMLLLKQSCEIETDADTTVLFDVLSIS